LNDSPIVKKILAPLPLWIFVSAVILTVITTVAYFAIWWVIPDFYEMYSTIGSELTAATLLVVKLHLGYLLLTLFGVVPCAVLAFKRKSYFKYQNLTMVMLVLNFLLSLAVVVLTVYALYLPFLDL